MPLAVITGGPCSGKTTLVAEFARRGHATVPEAAILVIRELNERMGVDGQKQWRRTHMDEFQLQVAGLQGELERQADPETLTFCDRGRLDSLGYCRFNSIEPSAALLALLQDHAYGAVFVLDTLSAFETRSGTGRMSSREDSLGIRNCIDRAYRERGYEPCFVPELPVTDRADFVLDGLARNLSD